MKSTEKMIEQAKIEAMTKWKGYHESNLVTAIETGLVHGDRICVGPDCYCVIDGDHAVIIIRDSGEDEVLGREMLSDLTDEQVERITIRKAVDAAKVGHSVGAAC